jgi:hypothetical protein
LNDTPVDNPGEPAANDAEDPTSVELRSLLAALEAQHRELDAAIAALYDFPYLDQLQLQRLKKEKLHLKDRIARVKDALIPDLNA